MPGKILYCGFVVSTSMAKVLQDVLRKRTTGQVANTTSKHAYHDNDSLLRS
jgi:hypothetical protein